MVATISNVTGDTTPIATASATASIGDDDPAAAVLSVSEQGAENGADVEFTVTLNVDNDTGADITFDLVDVGSGSATSGLDYAALAGVQIVVADGARSGALVVPVIDDTRLEADETITARIESPSNGDLIIAVAEATGTIVDDETATATLAVLTDGAEEDGGAPRDILLEVQLDRPNETGTTLLFDIVDTLGGTATAGSDYTALPAGAQVGVLPGQSSGQLTIAVGDDALFEGVETVVLRLARSSDADVNLSLADVTANITDNETLSAALSAGDGAENNAGAAANVVFTVTLSAPNDTGRAVSFDLDDLATGTATAGADYAALPAGANPLGAGRCHQRQLRARGQRGRAVRERRNCRPRASARRPSLASPSAPTPPPPGIADDDGATADLSVTTAGDETGPVGIVYTVALDRPNDTGADVTVDLARTGGTATPVLDFAAIPLGAQVLIPDGASAGTLTVAVTDDALFENGRKRWT